MSKFLEYLGSLKSRLEGLGPITELCLTCGNESCDLDSVASALVYAHYQALRNPPTEDDVTNIPLLQCHLADFALKQDVQLLLDMLGIDSSGLCCLDDITPASLSGVGGLSLVLVDHNTPTGMLESYAPNIVKVIDHHQLAVDSVANKPEVSATIEMVGSCSSLVAKELLEDENYTIEQPAATLLLSAILLDTGNLKVASRTTEADKFAVEELTKLLPSSFNRESHFSKLREARFDISKLTIQQSLERDYKQVMVNGFTIGFSSITALLTDFLSADTVDTDFTQFQSKHNLDALLVLGISMPDPTTVLRQIAVFQPEGVHLEFSECVAGMLEAEDSLKCERLDNIPGFSGVLLDQGNPDMSRKHVLPIVTSFVKSIEPENPNRPNFSQSLQDTEVSTSSSMASGYPLEPSITVLPSQCCQEPPTPPAVPTTSKAKPAPIPEYTSAEECKDRRSQRFVRVGSQEITISMDMVEPYRKIIQHAGYIGETRQALVIISACYLPPRSLPNYNHVIYHTFYYVLSVLDQLIVDDYTIVYLHSGAPRNSMPSIAVLRRFYRNIDRRLRKQLKQLFIVHPTFWVKTMLHLSRPFISKKFWRKVHFIPTLQDLSGHVHLDEEYISTPVAAKDKMIMSSRPTSQKYLSTGQQSTGNKSPATTTEDSGTITGKQPVAGEESTSDEHASNMQISKKQDIPSKGTKNEE